MPGSWGHETSEFDTERHWPDDRRRGLGGAGWSCLMMQVSGLHRTARRMQPPSEAGQDYSPRRPVALQLLGPTPKASTTVHPALRLQVPHLFTELTVAAGQRTKSVLGRRGSSRREGRCIVWRERDGKTIKRLSSAGAVTTRAFIWLPAWVRAESLALLSIRHLDFALAGLRVDRPHRQVRNEPPSRRRWDALPLAISDRPIRPVDLDDRMIPTGHAATAP